MKEMRKQGFPILRTAEQKEAHRVYLKSLGKVDEAERLDRPELRERIARLKANIWKQPPDYKETYLWQNDLGFADTILAFLPDERKAVAEEIRKAERERIKEELAEFAEMLKSAPEMHGDIQSDIPKTYKFLKWWEVLKEDLWKDTM